METLALSFPSPILRTGAGLHRYGRSRSKCLTVPHSLPKGGSKGKLKLKSGREKNENYDNATSEASVKLKELEWRRKILEGKKGKNGELKLDEAAIRKELERRRKISEKNKGYARYKGRKHSQETKEKISQKMVEVLSDPKVRKRWKGRKGQNLSEKQKELISAQQKKTWAERLKAKRAEQSLHDNWAQIIAINAQLGGYSEKELDWDEYDKMMAEIFAEAILVENERRIEREKRKTRKAILARMKVKKPTEVSAKKKEDAPRTKSEIRKKYGTQLFNLNLKKRLSKLHDRKKKLESSSKSKGIVPERRSTSDEWDIEFIKERVNIGASLSSQLEMVRKRKKQETINSEQFVKE